ncbi:hypothetical protein TRVL_03852 [Trypanosoma vivax]|nr:hypothetical protein TRVL_03852 [Trypanosoma vivax]
MESKSDIDFRHQSSLSPDGDSSSETPKTYLQQLDVRVPTTTRQHKPLTSGTPPFHRRTLEPCPTILPMPQKPLFSAFPLGAPFAWTKSEPTSCRTLRTHCLFKLLVDGVKAAAPGFAQNQTNAACVSTRLRKLAKTDDH